MRRTAAALILLTVAQTPALAFFGWAVSYRVSSDSMLPLLRAGEVVRPQAYDDEGAGDDQPARGDVVVFTGPAESDVFMMRIVALGGDSVQMRGGVLHLNGEAVPSEPAEPVRGACPAYADACTFTRETLPGGPSYVVMSAQEAGPGDDTEEFLVPEGRYFVMGDNRDNSNDSRFGQTDFGMIGFVERAALRGHMPPSD